MERGAARSARRLVRPARLRRRPLAQTSIGPNAGSNRAETHAHRDRAWLCIERASAYEFAERFDDALAAAHRSLELHPWFRPGVQAEAHLLQ